MSVRPNPLLESALAYTLRRWPVFPVEPLGKEPLGALAPHGFKDAVCDEATIREWWGARPEANIGIPTGRPETFDVADFDSPSRLPVYLRLLAEFPKLPRVLTGSGGRHGLVAPGAHKSTTNKNGLDWRGRYRWIREPDGNLPTAPEWLLRELRSANNGGVRPPAAYIENAVASELAKLRGTEEPGRNDALNQAAFNLGQMVGADWLDHAEIEGQLRLVGLGIGLDSQEVHKTVRSGLEAGRLQPRKWRADVSEMKGSIATLLVGLADEHFRLGLDQDDEPFAVERERPTVGLSLRGTRGLRRKLAALYSRAFNKAPNAAALADALLVLEGRAFDLPRETLHLRTATVDDGIVIDLGDETGQVVVVNPGGWRLEGHSPVLFRRTRLTGVLPVPVPGGDFDNLRSLLNVTDSDWPLLRGFLLASLIPDIPHPVLVLVGEQGTAKSSTARMLVQLTDPSPAALRAQPKSPDDWQVAAGASHVVALDNLSSLPDWLSDAICRASTGDGLVKRELYSNLDVTVLAFRRVVILTAIALPGLRGDLGDRLLLVELEPIASTERRLDRELDARFEEQRPSLFGALLDLLTQTLTELPRVRLAELPRMADWARLLAALDQVIDGGALAAYNEKEANIADQVIEADPLAQAVIQLVREADWKGRAAELLDELNHAGSTSVHRSWPTTPAHLSAQLRRAAPSLRRSGVEIEQTRTKRGSVVRIGRRRGQGSSPGGPGTVTEWSGDRHPAQSGYGDTSSSHDDGDAGDARLPSPSSPKKTFSPALGESGRGGGEREGVGRGSSPSPPSSLQLWERTAGGGMRLTPEFAARVQRAVRPVGEGSG
jgi:hypothetical protein